MASDKSFVEFIADQMSDAGTIAYRQMFGEYALYCDGKVVALVCDDQLFVKPTAGGKAYIGAIVEAPPYPGAKLYYLIEEAFEDRDWLSGLIRITAQEVAVPKPQRSRTKGKPKPSRSSSRKPRSAQ